MPPPPPPGGGYMPPPPPGGGYQPQMGGGYGAARRTDGLAIASLIVGILGLVCCWIFFGVVLGPAAAIMGYISRNRIAQSGGALGGGGLAIAGLILGIIAFIASVVWIIFAVIGSHLSSTTS